MQYHEVAGQQQQSEPGVVVLVYGTVCCCCLCREPRNEADFWSSYISLWSQSTASDRGTGTAGFAVPHSWSSLRVRGITTQLGVTSTVTFSEQQKWVSQLGLFWGLFVVLVLKNVLGTFDGSKQRQWRTLNQTY